MNKLCSLGHHIWVIGVEKSPEGLPKIVRPFSCDRCGIIQLMTSAISAKLNTYCLRDKRLDKKARLRLAALEGK